MKLFLASQGLADISTRVDNTLHNMALDACTVLIDGLKGANAYVDQIAVCKDATKLFGKRATELMRNTLDAQQRVDYKTEVAVALPDLVSTVTTLSFPH